MMEAVSLEQRENGIVHIVFDDPDEKLNILSTQVMEALEKLVQEIERKAENNSLLGILIRSGKPDTFIAGADIEEIRDLEETNTAVEKSERGQNILRRLAEIPVPSAALINGVCLGGGLELALWCDYRFVVEEKDIKIGLPEVNLGIIPGFGGTQIFPRRVGLQQALKTILTGKTMNGKEAVQRGVADRSVPAGFAVDIIESFLLNDAEKKKLGKSGASFLERNPIGKAVIFSQAQKNVLEKTGGHYPAPLKAIDVMKKSAGMNIEEGLKIERQTFSELVTGEIAKNLVNVYFGRERLKNYVHPQEQKIPFTLDHAAVVGAGVMGGGIAWLFIHKNIPVRMKDINWKALGTGVKTIHDTNRILIDKNKLDPKEAEYQENLATAAVDYSGFADIPFAVEAIIEKPDLKKEVYKELEDVMLRNAVIATNTSSLTVEELCKDMKYPDRLVGMHFFNPPSKMPLVEVVSGPGSSDVAVAFTVRTAKLLGKVPVVVNDCPGFLVNRLLMPYLNEASYLAGEGVPIKQIDSVMEQFGWPMGPFMLMDMVGIDIGYEVAKVLVSAYGDRMTISPLFQELGERQDFTGKKSGKGFYLHGKGENSEEKKKVNPWVEEKLSRRRRSGGSGRNSPSDRDIHFRLMLPMLFEALRVLDERIVLSSEDVDMALVLGTGFPPFRGGLFRWARSEGLKIFQDYGQRFREDSGISGDGAVRFTPPDNLQKMLE